MSTVGALTLGLAMAGAVPALAQNSASGIGGNATKGTPATGETGNTGQANTNATSAGGTSRTGTSATGSAMTTGQTNSGGHTGSMSQSSTHMKSRTGMAHETTHRTRTATRRSRGISNANPDAQNGDVAQLNDQSLQAAQQGRTFTPTGGNM